MAGCILKKLADIKFVADLRDPVVGNIAAVHLIQPTDIVSKMEKRILTILEKFVVKYADIVIANTETHKRELINKFRVNKFRTVRNCFDEDDYKGISKEKYEKFTIAHIGSMYGLRKADVLFKAIKKLETELEPRPLNIEVLFVGSNAHQLQSNVEKYGVQKYVKLQGIVPHRRAIEIMTRAHLLLLIKATGDGGLGQIPAKFFEYLGARNRVLFIGPEQSEVAEIIKDTKCGYVVGGTEDALSALRAEYFSSLERTDTPLMRPKFGSFECAQMGNAVSDILC